MSKGRHSLEPFLLHEEVYQPLDVGILPLQLHLVCGCDIRLLEDFLRLLPRPFLRYADTALPFGFSFVFLCFLVLILLVATLLPFLVVRCCSFLLRRLRRLRFFSSLPL